MKNNNDKTAKYYDVISKFTKNSEITDQEVELIKNFVDADSDVLEIGSGSGRHAVEVAQLVEDLFCIDSSGAMTEIHKNKNIQLGIDNVELINADFLTFQNEEWNEKFNFIYLMWNTYNEIVLNEEDCERFFQQCKKFLIPGGKILINIDDSSKVDPSSFDFEYEVKGDEEIIRYSWKTSSYKSETNTSTSEETIKVKDEILNTLITQRYWNAEQVMELAQMNGFEFTRNERIRGNDELYLVFRNL